MPLPDAVDSGNHVAAEIRRLGRVFNPQVLAATYALYEPLQRRAPKDGLSITKNIEYGEHERHRLDIFTASNKPVSAPIVVYVHGGGYIGGERSPLPGLIYDNVPTFFARNGMVGVNMTYRLAPQHVWPSGALDVGQAVAWLRNHAAQFGGDPGKIFLMGQSAGATHVATWTFSPHVHGASGPGIGGAILLSGVFAPCHPDYYPSPPQSHQIAYFGDDPDKWAQMSPLNSIKPGHPPVFISVTEFAPPWFTMVVPCLGGRTRQVRQGNAVVRVFAGSQPCFSRDADQLGNRHLRARTTVLRQDLLNSKREWSLACTAA